jgi:5-methylcytosine-specific restriction enzyme subunit McrC
MTVAVELDETGPGRDVPLSAEQGRLLAASGVVKAAPSPYGGGVWQVAAAGRVGVARIGDIEVRVRPKVPVGRLLFLFGYAKDPGRWRDELVGLAEAPDLVPAVGDALARHVDRATRLGLLQGYRTYDDAAAVLRGRLREIDQLRRHHGMVVPLEVRYDEFTVDTEENRLLYAAVGAMLRVPRVPAGVRGRLRGLRARFTGVEPLARGHPLPDWTPTRLNQRYHAALHLAGLVLRATSFEHGAGPVGVNGFLLDMPRLFEDFVTAAVTEALAPYGGRVRPQDRHHLDVAGLLDVRPDLVWYAGDAPVAVVDAKYEAERSEGRYPAPDLYQMLTYCTLLGLGTGHLVYAKGNELAARHTVRRSGVELVCHALDLALPPGELLAQVDGVAASIAGSHGGQEPEFGRPQASGPAG